MATLVRRNPTMDVLFKKLSGGSYAVAVLNRGTSAIQVELHPADLGFSSSAGCHLEARDLWSGASQARSVHFAGEHCQSRYRDLAYPTVFFLRHADAYRNDRHDRSGSHHHEFIDHYTRCLTTSGNRRRLRRNFGGNLDDDSERDVEVRGEMSCRSGWQDGDGDVFRQQNRSTGNIPCLETW